ncbi:MAG: ABC transporter permease subunit [Rhodothermales bacterium]|nr:ABC transporter permease subunit [Rhodothermales bacterium]
MNATPNTLWTVVGYQLRDAVKSRWLLQHTLIYLLVAEGLLLAGGSGERALVSLVNVVLLLVPLGALVFGTMHLYNARDFILLLLTQPVERKSLFGGIYLGLAIPESLGLIVGLVTPFALHGKLSAGVAIELAVLTGLAVLLTCIFTALALLIATHAKDRVRCIGIALGVWLAMAIVYDGMVLLAVNALAEFPIEKPLMALMMVNPVDLARVLLLNLFDAQALMGYTGAVFARFFASPMGFTLVAFSLTAWLLVPFVLTRRAFARKDF